MIAESPQVRFNPFPGLRPFEPDEDHLFFGREEQIDELLRRLRETRFLAILGTSGSGKSSLVRAGMIPSLHGGGMTKAGSSWRVAVVRPGDDPIGNLAAALADPEALDGAEEEEGLARAFYETTLRASNLGLVECVRQARIPARDNVLVLIDQFEELFRFRGDREAARDDAVAFVKLLLEASRQREAPIYITLTMRSDFMGNCMEFAGLPEAVNEGLYLVPRMNRDELRQAVTGPVAVGGGKIAPRLVSRLLNDVGDDPDQLPLLQHSLLRTWDLWEHQHVPGEPVDLRHYEAIGTMKEALSRHAEEAYGELDAEGQRIAELMFKALSDKGIDDRGIRRPAAVSEICALAGASLAEVVAVVETFRRPGRSFLMPPAAVPLQDSSILDLSHESLMRIWGRLTAWVEEEARSARRYLGAARAAARYEEGSAALWRDPELQLALTWREAQKPTPEWARRYDPSFERAMAFLDASKAERDRELQEREERRRRELQRARTLVLVLATASVFIFAFGAYAYLQKWYAETALVDKTREEQRATREQKRAERQKQEALRQKGLAEQQRQAAERERSKAEQQTWVAEQERANAERQSKAAEEQRRIAETERQNAEVKEREARIQKTQADEAKARADQARSEEEKQRARAETSAREARRLSILSWARALALQIQRLPRDARERPALLALQAYQLNQDNQGEPEDPDLFNALRAALGHLRPEPVLRGHGDGVRAVALAPDRSSLVSGSEDGSVRRFDLRHPESPPAVLGSFDTGVRAVALSGGDLLAAGTAGGALRLWDLGHPGAPPKELSAQGPLVTSLAFQPRGRWLAAGGQDGSVRLWDAGQAGGPAARIDTGGRRVTSLAFSPDGRVLAAGLAQGGALLWDVERTADAPRNACAGKDVRSVAFSADGKTLACGTGKGEILLWDPAAQSGRAPLLGHASSVNSLSFSPEGGALASASSDGSLRLWNLREPEEQPVVLRGHDSWIWAVAFSPDGDSLASGSEDRTIRIWPARTKPMADEICRRVGRRLTADEWQQLEPPPDLPFEAQRGCPAGS